MDFLEVINNTKVRSIPITRNYWFIRTYSGKLYNEFSERNYVGIGYNRVPYTYISDAAYGTSGAFEKLRGYLEDNYRLEGGEITKWANQLIRFERDISIGDIIVIPSEGSDEFRIGEVVGNTYVSDETRSFYFDSKYEPYPEKRKKIKWIKEIKRTDFLGDTRSMITTHLAVTDINSFGTLIESNITSLFLEGTEAHFTIVIKQNEDINAFALQRYLSSITYFYTEFCRLLGEDDNEELYIKIKVQSKGAVSFRSHCLKAFVGLAIISQLSDSEGFKIDLGIAEIEKKSSDGLITSALKAINNLADGGKKLYDFIESKRELEADTISTSETLESDITAQDSLLNKNNDTT